MRGNATCTATKVLGFGVLAVILGFGVLSWNKYVKSRPGGIPAVTKAPLRAPSAPTGEFRATGKVDYSNPNRPIEQVTYQKRATR